MATGLRTGLSPSQLTDYQRDGFVVLRGVIADAEISRLEGGFARNPPLDGTLYDIKALQYPEPGRYTLANNCLKDPDLAFLAEHPTITAAVGDALGGDPVLTTFVIYERTPGGSGIPSHNDYKRWRPVGSSMNWAFTVVPFCDFDAQAGQLFVAPGSHRLDRISEGPERPRCVAPAIKPSEDCFVDPELRRGDLLVMNMHTWHRASGNTSDHSRTGAFNKYASADAPPATGYFLYDDDVFNALTPEGRSVIAVHSDKPIATTRLLLTRLVGDGSREILLVTGDDGKLRLAGGPVYVEQAIADWDRGNYIASLQSHLREQIRIETPWVSYVGDFDEGPGLCRVYAYDLTGDGFPVGYTGRWLNGEQLEAARDDLAFGYEPEALDRWLDPTIVRGKGLTQAQSRVNQYAY